MFALIIYPLLRLWVKLGLRLFYRKISLINKEFANTEGAAIYCANHPNTLLDALLLTAFVSGRPWFLVRADIFKKPGLAKFFHNLHMFPVYRVRDGYSSLKKNDLIFEECKEVLQKGGKVILFPEGSHSAEPKVRKFQKGVDRLLELAQDCNPKLYNVGLLYQAPSKIFTKVTLHFQEVELGENDSLHQAMEASMKKLVPHIETEQYEERKVVYQHVQRLKLLPASSKGSSRVGFTAHLNTLTSEVINNLQESVQQSKELLNQAGVFFWRETTLWQWFSEFFLCLFSFPVFALGWLIRLPGKLVYGRLIKNVKDHHFHSTFHFMLGLVCNTLVLTGLWFYLYFTSFSWIAAVVIWLFYVYSVWFSIVWQAKWTKVSNLRKNLAFSKSKEYSTFLNLRSQISSVVSS